MWSIHTTKYESKTKGNEVLIYPRSCINIENTLSEKKKLGAKDYMLYDSTGE
jgi:hypothetical protein